MSKCDMCIDRVRANLLPMCVKSCAMGAMSFGERSDMLALALAARLGGVHFACYDDLEETALHLLRQPNATRLTDGEVTAWQRFASDLWAWDGMLSSLRRLFGVPVATGTEARCAAHELDRSQERPS